MITNEILAKFPIDSSLGSFRVVTDHMVLANINLKNSESGVLSIISPGSKKKITIREKNIENPSEKADSLVNYLWKSTNEMFSKHNRIIFSEEKPDSVLWLFDSLIDARARIISDNADFLTNDEMEVLKYQNSARAYSFLMFYGRIMNKISVHKNINMNILVIQCVI